MIEATAAEADRWRDAALRTVIVCAPEDGRYRDELLSALAKAGVADMLVPDPPPTLSSGGEAAADAFAQADVRIVLVSRRPLPAELTGMVDQLAASRSPEEGQLVPILVEDVRGEERGFMRVQERFPILSLQALPGDLPIEHWPIREMAWRAVAAGLRDILWYRFLNRLVDMADRLPAEQLPPRDKDEWLERYLAYRELARPPRHPLRLPYPFKRRVWTVGRGWPFWAAYPALLFLIAAPPTSLESAASVAQAFGFVLAASLPLAFAAAVRERRLLRVSPRSYDQILQLLFDGAWDEEDSGWVMGRVRRSAVLAGAVAAAASGAFALADRPGPAVGFALGALAGLTAYATTLRRIPAVYRASPAPDPSTSLIRRHGFGLRIVTAHEAGGTPGLPLRRAGAAPVPVIEGERLVVDLGAVQIGRAVVEAALILGCGVLAVLALDALAVPPSFAVPGGVVVVGMALAWFQERFASPSLFPGWFAYLRFMAFRLLVRGVPIGIIGMVAVLLGTKGLAAVFGWSSRGGDTVMLAWGLCLLFATLHRLWVILMLSIRSERGG